MSASNVTRFYPLPASLNLLSPHSAYPTVGLRSQLQRGDLVNHVPNLLGAAAFFPRNALRDFAAVRRSYGLSDDGESGSPVNLCTTNRQAGQLDCKPDSDNTLTAAWPPYPCNEPIHAADSANIHGVGVFQRLLALMSRRVSALDGIEKRYAQHPVFGGPWSTVPI